MMVRVCVTMCDFFFLMCRFLVEGGGEGNIYCSLVVSPYFMIVFVHGSHQR